MQTLFGAETGFEAGDSKQLKDETVIAIHLRHVNAADHLQWRLDEDYARIVVNHYVPPKSTPYVGKLNTWGSIKQTLELWNQIFKALYVPKVWKLSAQPIPPRPMHNFLNKTNKRTANVIGRRKSEFPIQRSLKTIVFTFLYKITITCRNTISKKSNKYLKSYITSREYMRKVTYTWNSQRRIRKRREWHDWSPP